MTRSRSKQGEDARLEKIQEEKGEALYCERRGFTRIQPQENPLQIKVCRKHNCNCYDLPRD
jgi:hypothetical protein